MHLDTQSRRFPGALALALICGLFWAALADASLLVKAARVWPSPEYSRVTLELDDAVVHKHFQLANPARLVIDLEGVEPAAALAELPGLVSAEDRYIGNIRVALNRPGVTRIVAELKTAVVPQVFTLKPMGGYGHRLVIDFYPAGAQLPPQNIAPVMPEATLDKQVEAAIEQADRQVEKTPRPPQVKAALNPVPTVKPPAASFNRLITVVIDAGHGGVDPGAVGARGSLEKDITLAIAQRLKTHIDRIENMRAVLTRDGDYFIPLHERVNRARRAQADLFVSIHADAWIRRDARGSSVYALSEQGATSSAARWLAKKENEADLIGGVNIDVRDVYLKQTLISLSQDAQIRDSLNLGRFVLSQLSEINELHKRDVEQAGFAVLKAPDIPSILIETAFISNPEEEKRLNDEAYQEKMAASIATGIKHYFEKNPPMTRSRMAKSL